MLKNGPFFNLKKFVVLRKSACSIGQVETKMYMSKSPFFKKSLAGASGQVLMSNPEMRQVMNTLQKLHDDMMT